MTFGKIKQTKFGVDADYHTIIKVNIDLSQIPTAIKDNQGNTTGYKGGSKSYVTIASYKDQTAYLSKAIPLDSKTYEFDFVTTTQVVNSTEKTCKQAAYDLLKSVDAFWLDAETV